MFIPVTDSAGNITTINAQHIIAVLVPPLIAMTPNDGKSRIFLVGPIIVEVSKTEAGRILALITGGDSGIYQKES